MKILMITNDLYPYLNATSGIVYRIARELVDKYSCDISVIGYNDVLEKKLPKPDFKLETLRIKSVTDCNRIRRKYVNAKVLRFLNYCTHPAVFTYFLRCKKNNQHSLVIEYQREILKAVKRKKYDCIIGFMMPTETLLAISQLNLDIPFIAYKLDPWATNFALKDKKEEWKKDADADKKARRIIVPSALEKDYKTYASEDILKKLMVVEFPNMLPYEKKKTLSRFQDGKIHCTFTGALYKKIRNPKYTIKLFEKLLGNRVMFHMIGMQYGDSLPDTLPDNVTHHGQVSSDEAMRYMQSADILVNIGNTILNQMPSKILTYISLGKPILNIIKSPNCPTLPYMAKYPLALNVLETPEVRQEDADRVSDFIKNNVGKRIPFEEIKEKYYTCTPEYVGKQLYDVICEVVEEHKEKAQKEQHDRKSV